MAVPGAQQWWPLTTVKRADRRGRRGSARGLDITPTTGRARTIPEFSLFSSGSADAAVSADGARLRA